MQAEYTRLNFLFTSTDEVLRDAWIHKDYTVNDFSDCARELGYLRQDCLASEVTLVYRAVAFANDTKLSSVCSCDGETIWVVCCSSDVDTASVQKLMSLGLTVDQAVMLLRHTANSLRESMAIFQTAVMPRCVRNSLICHRGDSLDLFFGMGICDRVSAEELLGALLLNPADFDIELSYLLPFQEYDNSNDDSHPLSYAFDHLKRIYTRVSGKGYRSNHMDMLDEELRNHLELIGEYTPNTDIDGQSEALRQLRIAADLGGTYVQVLYSQMLLEQCKSCSFLVRLEAYRYMKLAVERNNPLVRSQLKAAFAQFCSEVLKKESQASRYYQESAGEGLAASQLQMGVRLLLGRGVRQNKAEGIRYIKMAADQGLQTAQVLYHLAIATNENQGGQTASKIGDDPSLAKKVPFDFSDVERLGKCGGMWNKDQSPDKVPSFDITEFIDMVSHKMSDESGMSPEKTAEHWNKLACEMDPHGMAMYGRCLADGYGVQKNLRRAVRYYRNSAELGDQTGQMFYAQCCATGEYVPKDLQEAEKYFKMAVNQGSAEAQTQYATFLIINFGNDPAKAEEARRYLKLAADQGEAAGQGMYGCILLGSGNAKDREEGIRYIKDAADQGHPSAQIAYAFLILSGSYGVEKDVVEGLRYIRLAADRETAVPKAQYLCAQFLGSGDDAVCLAEAARYYKLAADQGLAEAQLQYGALLEKGVSFAKNIVEATRYYKLAADQGLAEAQFLYGKALWKSVGDVQKAAQYFKRAADQGYAHGQVAYGFCLMSGDGVAENVEEGVRYIKLAADQGDPVAAWKLGTLFEKGFSVVKDVAEAMKYYKYAADQGIPEAQVTYGFYCAKGPDSVRNLAVGAQYFKLAADQGHKMGQLNYGLCLRDGKGVAKDKTEAIRYVKLAAQQGISEAQYTYAQLIEDQDLFEAVQYYKLAADQGLPCAQMSYGWHLEHGLGVSENLSEAIKHYRLAANNGFADAQVRYGRYCAESNPPNYPEAARYYKLAADQGDVIGQMLYASALKEGQGVRQNFPEAARYLKLAVDQGNLQAINMYAAWLRYGDVVPQNLSEAARLFKMAADQGSVVAQYNYGMMLIRGMGVATDYWEAARYMKMAADTGDLPALDAYKRCLLAIQMRRRFGMSQ